jgi:hypothetical protein
MSKLDDIRTVAWEVDAYANSVEDVRYLLGMVEEMSKMMNWQLIDTAPKTEVILGFDPAEGIEIIGWSKKAYRPGNEPWVPGWECPAAHDNGTVFDPTHWISLPSPPTDTTGEPRGD